MQKCQITTLLFTALLLSMTIAVTSATVTSFTPAQAKAKWTFSSGQLATELKWYFSPIKSGNARFELTDNSVWNSTNQAYIRIETTNATGGSSFLQFLIKGMGVANNVQITYGTDGEVISAFQAYPNPNKATNPNLADWKFYLKGQQVYITYFNSANETVTTTPINVVTVATNMSYATVGDSFGSGTSVDVTSGTLTFALYAEINPAAFSDLATYAIIIAVLGMFAGGIAIKKSRS